MTELTQSEVDELGDGLPGSKGFASLRLGTMGGIKLQLTECPCVYSIGIKFSGTVYLGKVGIKIPDENEDVLARLLLKMFREQCKENKNAD